MNRKDIDMELMRIKLIGHKVDEITFNYIEDNNRITAFIGTSSTFYMGKVKVNYNNTFHPRPRGHFFDSNISVDTVKEAVDFVEALGLFSISTFRILHSQK